VIVLSMMSHTVSGRHRSGLQAGQSSTHTVVCAAKALSAMQNEVEICPAEITTDILRKEP